VSKNIYYFILLFVFCKLSLATDFTLCLLWFLLVTYFFITLLFVLYSFYEFREQEKKSNKEKRAKRKSIVYFKQFFQQKLISV